MSREFILDHRKFPNLKHRKIGASQFWGGDKNEPCVAVSLTHQNEGDRCCSMNFRQWFGLTRKEAKELGSFLLEFGNGKQAEGF
jgi:hypothetical protein